MNERENIKDRMKFDLPDGKKWEHVIAVYRRDDRTVKVAGTDVETIMVSYDVVYCEPPEVRVEVTCDE